MNINYLIKQLNTCEILLLQDVPKERALGTIQPKPKMFQPKAEDIITPTQIPKIKSRTEVNPLARNKIYRAEHKVTGEMAEIHARNIKSAQKKLSFLSDTWKEHYKPEEVIEVGNTKTKTVFHNPTPKKQKIINIPKTDYVVKQLDILINKLEK